MTADAFAIYSTARLRYLGSPALITMKVTSVPELEAKGFLAMGECFGCELNSNCVEDVLRGDLLAKPLD
jgi:hypothetical protein